MGFLFWQQNFFFNFVCCGCCCGYWGVWRVFSDGHGTWMCLGIRESIPHSSCLLLCLNLYSCWCFGVNLAKCGCGFFISKLIDLLIVSFMLWSSAVCVSCTKGVSTTANFHLLQLLQGQLPESNQVLSLSLSLASFFAHFNKQIFVFCFFSVYSWLQFHEWVKLSLRLCCHQSAVVGCWLFDDCPRHNHYHRRHHPRHCPRSRPRLKCVSTHDAWLH